MIAADLGELSSCENLADAVASCDGLACGTEGVVLHALAIKKDVIADEEDILEDVKGETWCVAVYVEGLDALMDEVIFKGGIEGKGAADLVNRIVTVDVHLGGKQFPVEVGGPEEVVMCEKYRHCVLERSVKRRRAVDPAGAATGLDPVGSVLEAEWRMGIQPSDFVAHRCGHHLVTGGALLGGDEMLLRRATERAAIGVKADHVEAAYQTDILLTVHADDLPMLQPVGRMEEPQPGKSTMCERM